MLLQHQTVSRKTPLDGRLEISAATAERLAGRRSFRITTGLDEADGSLQALPCTCGKRGEGAHLHHFLESPLLRGLTPGAEVRVELDDDGSVRILPSGP